MKIIIFTDNDGCSRSIRGNCIQPCMGGIGKECGRRYVEQRLHGGDGGVVCVMG